MIIAKIVIEDSDGKVLVPPQQFDAARPFQWRTPVDRPLVDIEAREGDGQVIWSLYGLTYQPMVQRELRRRQP